MRNELASLGGVHLPAPFTPLLGCLATLPKRRVCRTARTNQATTKGALYASRHRQKKTIARERQRINREIAYPQDVHTWTGSVISCTAMLIRRGRKSHLIVAASDTHTAPNPRQRKENSALEWGEGVGGDDPEKTTVTENCWGQTLLLSTHPSTPLGLY